MNFIQIFGVHQKGQTPVDYSLDESITVLEKVYGFDKDCTEKVKERLGILEN